jgi:hypothetical protein
MFPLFPQHPNTRNTPTPRMFPLFPLFPLIAGQGGGMSRPSHHEIAAVLGVPPFMVSRLERRGHAYVVPHPRARMVQSESAYRYW